jgi:hypothetical protein
LRLIQYSHTSLFLVTFVSACLYVLNEWIFFVTKPSFLNNLGAGQQLQVLLTVSLFIGSLFLLSLLPLAALSRIPALQEHTGRLVKLGGLVPAGILACLVLIIVDNATYTLFRFGIVSTAGWSRALYGLGFLLLTAFLYRDVLKVMAFLSRRVRLPRLAPLWIFSLLAGLLILVSPLATGRARLASPPASLEESALRPHILLITSDGLSASHISVYGYERETTPNLEKLAASSLVAENAFPNAGNSTGSVISIYTGKYPAETRVVYPPDILRGDDSYEHLPGLLRAEGYRTVQVTLPHYMDAGVQNMVNGFDMIRTNKDENSRFLPLFQRILPNNPALFIDKILNRIADRLRHIFFLQKMINPFLLANQLEEGLRDIDRWDILRNELRTTSQPLFVHVHMMETHGELFNPQVQVYSAGRAILEQEPWETDFYDDSILAFDALVGEMIGELTDLGLLEDTLLIIGSDHGQQFKLQRIPLIIRFPRGQYAGTIQANVQNLDLAPTILDYLELDPPEWMDGRSLLAGGLDARPIFFVNEAVRERNPQGGFAINLEKVEPPFYQFSGISMIYCGTLYSLDLYNGTWSAGPVEGTTYACPPEAQISEAQAYAWIVEHLEENGFDVSTLDSVSP